MSHANDNNRSTEMSPELAVQLNADIDAAVKSITEQYLAAVKEHPEDMAEAAAKYLGKSL